MVLQEEGCLEGEDKSRLLCIPLLLSSFHSLHERSHSVVLQESSELLLALKGAIPSSSDAECPTATRLQQLWAKGRITCRTTQPACVIQCVQDERQKNKECVQETNGSFILTCAKQSHFLHSFTGGQNSTPSSNLNSND